MSRPRTSAAVPTAPTRISPPARASWVRPRWYPASGPTTVARGPTTAVAYSHATDPDFAAPSVGLQSQQSGGRSSSRVVPYQDQRIRQTQELAQTVQGIGTEVMRCGQQLSAEYDDAKVKRGDNRLADVIRKELEDPTNGYPNQVGEKAIGKTREDAFKRIEQQAQSLMQGDGQRHPAAGVSMQVERQMRQALGRADEHEARQTKAFAIGQTKPRPRGQPQHGGAALRRHATVPEPSRAPW